MRECFRHPVLLLARMRNFRGFSLISTLLAVAITLIVGLALASVMGDVFGLLGRGRAMAIIDGAQQTLYGIVLNRRLCDSAIRSSVAAGSTQLSFPVPGAVAQTIEIGQIQVYNPSGSAMKYDTGSPPGMTPQNMGGGVMLTRIRFTETTPPVRGQVTIAGVNYDTYAGQIILSFQFQNLTPFAGALRDRSVPLTIAVQTNPPRFIDFCYFDASFRQLCNEIGGTVTQLPDGTLTCSNLSQFKNFTGFTCPDTCGVPPAECVSVPFVQGILANSQPDCQCRIVCPPPVPPPSASGSGAGSGGSGGPY